MPTETDSEMGSSQRLGKLATSFALPAAGKWRRQRVVVFLVVLVVAGVLSGAGIHLVQAELNEERRARFAMLASDRAAAVQRSFDLSFELLLAIPPFFRNADGVSRQEFLDFIEPGLDRHPEIYAFEYAPRIPDTQRGEFEASTRAAGAPDFEIKELNPDGNVVVAAARPEYFPVVFAGAELGAEYFGIDLGSVPTRQAFMLSACDGVDQDASEPLSLLEDPEDVLSVVVYTPIRFEDTQTTDRCDGIAQLLLRIEAVIEGSMGVEALDLMELILSDPDKPVGAQLIFNNFPGDGFVEYPNPVVEQIQLVDQMWELTMRPLEGSDLAPRPPSYWLYAVGLVVSLLTAYAVSAVVAIGGLQQQVDEALEMGQYQLGDKLGEGGMGEVYEARHRSLARPAAIKLIRPEALGVAGSSGSGSADSILARFEKEARTTAGLESPHTIAIYDFGKTPGGAFYYVMELLRGMDLETLVKTHGPIEAPRAMFFLRQACASLGEAHEKGLIHRDVKPANIFVCQRALEYDFVKVLDFGLVKSRKASADSMTLTQAGALMGTPAFMAPEMLREGEIDGRADIYALGCVAYWMLTGEYVFASDSLTDMLVAHIQTEPTPPSAIGELEIPEALEALILQCLSKDPEDRPPTATAMADRLAELQVRYPWTNQDAERWWCLGGDAMARTVV